MQKTQKVNEPETFNITSLFPVSLDGKEKLKWIVNIGLLKDCQVCKNTRYCRWKSSQFDQFYCVFCVKPFNYNGLCPMNHQFKHQILPINGCDSCRIQIKSSYAWRCQECNFDFCQGCWNSCTISQKKQINSLSQKPYYNHIQQILDKNRSKQDNVQPQTYQACCSKRDEIEQEDCCVVCLTEKREYLMVPCGHLCLCFSCKGLIENQCPICKSKADTIIQLYP